MIDFEDKLNKVSELLNPRMRKFQIFMSTLTYQKKVFKTVIARLPRDTSVILDNLIVQNPNPSSFAETLISSE